MSLEAYLEKITQYHPAEIDLGLDRISAVASQCLSTQFPCPVVTVGGTNGKGTTVAALSALAQAAGLKVATYTSPHLYRFNERIKINGVEIDDETLLELLKKVEEVKGETSLTFFEWTTLAALFYFHQVKPDLIILEVGMGGRLDATNLIDPSIAIITSIGLDHVSYLGDTKEKIALEKAGIMRAGKPVIVGEQALGSLLRCAADKVGALFYGLGSEFQLLDGVNSTLVPSNLACAAKAAELLGLPYSQAALESVQVPGRKQWLEIRGKQVLFDVAHNEDSVNELLRYLSSLPPKRIHLVLGMMKDKDFGPALDELTSSCATIHLASPKTSRAMPAEELMDLIPAPSQIYPDIPCAFASALAYARDEDCVLVTGSFYTVSEAGLCYNYTRAST